MKHLAQSFVLYLSHELLNLAKKPNVMQGKFE